MTTACQTIAPPETQQHYDRGKKDYNEWGECTNSTNRTTDY